MVRRFCSVCSHFGKIPGKEAGWCWAPVPMWSPMSPELSLETDAEHCELFTLDDKRCGDEEETDFK